MRKLLLSAFGFVALSATGEAGAADLTVKAAPVERLRADHREVEVKTLHLILVSLGRVHVRKYGSRTVLECYPEPNRSKAQEHATVD